MIANKKWVETFQTEVNSTSYLPETTYQTVNNLTKFMEAYNYSIIDLDWALSFLKEWESLKPTKEFPLQLFKEKILFNL